MVDVINSSVASVANLRSNAAAQSAVKGATDNVASQALTESVASAPKPPYLSLFISVDYNYDKAVLQVRDSDTGDVQDQFPTESRLAELRRAQQFAEQQRLQTKEVAQATPETSQSSAPQSSSADIITVQEITSAPTANTPQVSPQIASAALNAGAQANQISQSAGVSVLT